MEGIYKVDSNAKLIYFSNFVTYGYGDDVSKDLSLQEALKKQIIIKNISIVTYSNLKDEDIESIKTYLLEINYRGSLTIYETSKDNYLKVENIDDGYILLKDARYYSMRFKDNQIYDERSGILYF